MTEFQNSKLQGSNLQNSVGAATLPLFPELSPESAISPGDHTGQDVLRQEVLRQEMLGEDLNLYPRDDSRQQQFWASDAERDHSAERAESRAQRSDKSSQRHVRPAERHERPAERHERPAERHERIAWQIATTLRGQGRYRKVKNALTTEEKRLMGNAVCAHLLASFETVDPSTNKPARVVGQVAKNDGEHALVS